MIKENKDFLFRTKTGELISNIASYSEDQILNDFDCKVYIGIDSQYYKKYNSAYFAIVCAYHYGSKFKGDRIGHGIHYVYHDFVDSTVKDKKDRLRKETLYLMEFISYLKFDQKFIDFSIELDYNLDDSKLSNQFVEGAKSYALGLGVTNVIFKPDTVACKAADHVVRASFKGISKIDKLKKQLGK